VVYNSTISLGSANTTVVEGGFQFSTKVNGKKWYYLFFSSGKCCQAKDQLAPAGEEYKVMVCRSDSPTGPFSDQAGRNCLSKNGGTLVLGSHGFVYAPGGQGVLVDDDGRSVMYYHYGTKPPNQPPTSLDLKAYIKQWIHALGMSTRTFSLGSTILTSRLDGLSLRLDE
jgi:beta-xylosidase